MEQQWNLQRGRTGKYWLRNVLRGWEKHRCTRIICVIWTSSATITLSLFDTSYFATLKSNSKKIQIILQGSVFSLYLHDAVYMYALATDELLKEGGYKRNGSRIFEIAKNKTFDGRSLNRYFLSCLHFWCLRPVYTYRFRSRALVRHRQSLPLCEWWWTVWRTDWVQNPFCLSNGLSPLV